MRLVMSKTHESVNASVSATQQMMDVKESVKDLPTSSSLIMATIDFFCYKFVRCDPS